MKYKDIASEVARLRDKEKMSFVKIAEKLKVSKGTVSRAYDHAHPKIVQEAAEKGETPHRGQYSHLGEEKYAQIRQLLQAGVKPTEVAKQVGCGVSTVNREKLAMQAKGNGKQSA